jgi:limonene 1,2-monooxygenase
MTRLRFGVFMAPFHQNGTNPNANLFRDLDLIEHLDRLGFDEAWFGEHHSGGTEIVGDPMLFCAHAFGGTRNIRLGAGVVSVPYHNPFWVAERTVFLDHLSRGRFMLGMGPGALATDAYMLGIHSSEQRRMLEEGMEAIMHLLYRDEPLTMQTDWFNLVEAKVQLPRWSERLDVVTAAVQSPSGPRLAGRHGAGILQIGATLHAGADVLALHSDVWNEVAAEHGHTVDRSTWRLVGLVHVAETRQQAVRDVEYGIDAFFDYLQKTATISHFVPQGDTLEERVAWINEAGFGAIGTAEDCIAQIESLWEQSNGGFGAYLNMHNDFANPEATRRSYELIAERVMPHFQNQTHARLVDAAERSRGVRDKLLAEQQEALAAWTQMHQAERATQVG